MRQTALAMIGVLMCGHATASSNLDLEGVEQKFADLFGSPAAICHIFYTAAAKSFRKKTDRDSVAAAQIAESYAATFGEIFVSAYQDRPERAGHMLAAARVTFEHFATNDPEAFAQEQSEVCPATLAAIGGASKKFLEDAVTKKIPDAPLDSWSLLFDPKRKRPQFFLSACAKIRRALRHFPDRTACLHSRSTWGREDWLASTSYQLPPRTP